MESLWQARSLSSQMEETPPPLTGTATVHIPPPGTSCHGRVLGERLWQTQGWSEQWQLHGLLDWV